MNESNSTLVPVLMGMVYVPFNGSGGYGITYMPVAGPASVDVNDILASVKFVGD